MVWAYDETRRGGMAHRGVIAFSLVSALSSGSRAAKFWALVAVIYALLALGVLCHAQSLDLTNDTGRVFNLGPRMRAQKIVRVVNALAGQQRIILWLECNHKVSISAVEHASMTPIGHAQMQLGRDWPCPHCPDVPERPKEKTAHQLWREAGEP